MGYQEATYLRQDSLRIKNAPLEKLTHFQAINEIKRLTEGRGMWLPLQISDYRDLFERMQNLNHIPHHDLAHNFRVLLYTRPILKLMEAATNKLFNNSVVEAVAIEHDRRRSGIKFDWWHGWLASKDLEKDFKWMDMKDLILAAQICKWHSVEDNLTPRWIKRKIEWAVFCDADNLDRTRLKDFNPKYLRLHPSLLVVPIAQELTSLSAQYQTRGVESFESVFKAGQDIGLIERTNSR